MKKITLKISRFLKMWVAMLALGIVFVGCQDGAIPAPATEVIEPQVGEFDLGEVRIPEDVVGFETIAPSVVRAGEEIQVECLFVNKDGEQTVSSFMIEPWINVSPEAAVQRLIDGRVFAKIPVKISVQCAASLWGLLDHTPSEITIVPGEVVHMDTELEDSVVEAGQWTQVDCRGYDKNYNDVGILEDAVVVSEQYGSGVEVRENQIRFSQVGLHQVSCRKTGVADVMSETLSVVEAKASQMIVTLSPRDGQWVDLGQDVELHSHVTDAYGNTISDALIDVDILPGCLPGQSAKECGFEMNRDGSIIFHRSGSYDVVVALDSDWAQANAVRGNRLEVRKEVKVKRDAPAITCVGPRNYAMVQHELGEALDFRVQLNHEEGIEHVRIKQRDGEWQEANRRGRRVYGASVLPEYGFNHVEIQVERDDKVGPDSETHCVFLASEYFHEEGQWTQNTASVKIQEQFLDNQGGRLDSLGEVFRKILQSESLEETIRTGLDESLSAIPRQKINKTVEWDGPDFDVNINLGVRLREFDLGENREIEFDLTEDELVVEIQIENLHLGIDVPLNVQSRISPPLFFTPGIDVSIGQFVTVSRYPIEFVDGQIRLGVADVSVETSDIGLDIDAPDTSDYWWLFFVEDMIDTYASQASNSGIILMQHILNTQAGGILQNLLSDSLGDLGFGLEIEGAGIKIPKIGGGGNINIGYGLRASSLQVDPDGILVGLGSKLFVENPGHSRPSLGVPTWRLVEDTFNPPAGRSFSAGINVDFVNQALHTLWRGGMFDYGLNSTDQVEEEDEGELEEISVDPNWSKEFCGELIPQNEESGEDACNPELPELPGVFDSGEGDPIPFTVSLKTALPPIIKFSDTSFTAHGDEDGNIVRSVPAEIELATEVLVDVPSFLPEPLHLMVSAGGSVRVGVVQRDQYRVVKIRRENNADGEFDYWMDSNFMPGKTPSAQERSWEKISDSFQMAEVYESAERRHEGDAATCVEERELALYLGNINLRPEDLRVVPIGGLGANFSPEILELLEEAVFELVEYGLTKVVKLQDCVNAQSLFSLPIPRQELFNQVNFSQEIGENELNVQYNMYRFDLPMASTIGPESASIGIENGFLSVSGSVGIQGI